MIETAPEPATISAYVNKELDSLLPSIKDYTSDLQRLADLLKISQDSRIVSQEEVTELETLEKKAAVERTFRKREYRNRLILDNLFLDIETCAYFLPVIAVCLFVYTCIAGQTPFWIQVVWSGPSAAFEIAMIACYMLVNIRRRPKRQPVAATEQPQSTMTSEELNHRQTELLNVFKTINRSNRQYDGLRDESAPDYIQATATHLVYFLIRLINSVCYSDASILAIVNVILFFALSVITIYVFIAILRERRPNFETILVSLYWKCFAEENKGIVKSKKRICRKCKKTLKK